MFDVYTMYVKQIKQEVSYRNNPSCTKEDCMITIADIR